jgi:hypothetical protein
VPLISTGMGRALCLALAMALACSGVVLAAKKRPPDTRLHVGKGVGAAHVGMTPRKVAKVLHTRSTRRVSHESPEGRYRLRHVGVIVVEYDPESLRATLVRTRSRRFHYRALHVGSLRATVLRRLAGKGWRLLNCKGTELEVAYYPGKTVDTPAGDVPTARAEISLVGHERVQEMSAGNDVQLLKSSQCDDAAL